MTGSSPPPIASLAVINSGPLIALARIDRLDLLPALFTRVIAPGAVLAEVMADHGRRPGAERIATASWLERADASTPPDRLLAHELGAGETAVLALSLELGARRVILDDRKARLIASIAFDREVIGTLGVLVAAKQRGLVPALRPVVEQLITENIFLSPGLAASVLRRNGE